MKIYLLKQTFFNYDEGEEPNIEILGAYTTEEKALEAMETEIKDKKENYNCFESNSIINPKNRIVFWNRINNWQVYFELDIGTIELQ